MASIRTRPRRRLPCLYLPLLILCGCGGGRDRVVLYCAQDQEFAEQILKDFSSSTSIGVAPHYDTEANKTVVLYDELVRERRRPRCDVFWNNEILSTIRLQRQGLLEPYRSPAANPFPEWTKAKDGAWQAFAARARVLIVNTDKVSKAQWPERLTDLTQPRWKGQVAMAKPEFGTSATQAACLFEVLGTEAARKFYLDLKANQVAVVPGNKQVAEGVGRGEFAAGITDTDDALAEVRAGRPVAMIFPDGNRLKDDRMGTLFIPNSLAVIRGCPHPAEARRLVDFLLSPEAEAALANSESGQIPLNPEVKTRPPDPILTPATVKPMDIDFDKAAALWDEVQAFLRNEFGRP
jgi:iron(III) transport system substrate-binding protein